MKFSLVFLATLVAAVAAREFSCDHDNVGVCCTGHEDAYEKCRSAERRDDDQNQNQNQNQDPSHNQNQAGGLDQDKYFCQDSDFPKCCDDHDDINLDKHDGSTRRNCHDG